MNYIYKNGKRIKIGKLPTYIYLDKEKNVIAKGLERIDGFNKVIEGNTELINQVKPKSDNSHSYHKLKDNKEGKVISDYNEIYCLDVFKRNKCEAIDEKTDALIADGIAFDGQLFSTSSEAQRNWIALFAARDTLSYPISVTTRDDKEYIFENAHMVRLFYLTGIAIINNHISSGRELKIRVNESQTKECIESIIDPR